MVTVFVNNREIRKAPIKLKPPTPRRLGTVNMGICVRISFFSALSYRTVYYRVPTIGVWVKHLLYVIEFFEDWIGLTRKGML